MNSVTERQFWKLFYDMILVNAQQSLDRIDST